MDFKVLATTFKNRSSLESPLLAKMPLSLKNFLIVISSSVLTSVTLTVTPSAKFTFENSSSVVSADIFPLFTRFR